MHPGERATIDLDSGVRWEELAADREDGIDFLEAIYEVGGASTPDRSLMRHHGREYGYIMSGTLHIQIGFQTYVLGSRRLDRVRLDDAAPVLQRGRRARPRDLVRGGTRGRPARARVTPPRRSRYTSRAR